MTVSSSSSTFRVGVWCLCRMFTVLRCLAKEADNLVTNWARYIMEVNTFLEGEANDETLKQVTAETLRENANILPGTGAQPAVSFSCLEEPSIPFLGEFLIGTLVNDLKSPFALDSSQSRQLNLSNVLSFIRHLPQSSAVLNQSVLTGLAPGILSLVCILVTLASLLYVI